MGNNNATASLTEEESSKLETNGMSPLESVSIEPTQDQEFLAGEDEDGDKGKGTQETEPQNKELVEDTKVKNVEEEMHQNGLDSSVMETDEQLQKQTSVAKGAETVCEETEVEELSMIETQSVVSKLNTTEFLDEEKPCVIDEIVFVSPSFYEAVGTEEENMINETLEETVHEEVVVKVDQDSGMQHRTGFLEIEAQEILNLDHRIVGDEEVTNEGKSDQVIPNPGSQESNAIQEAGLEVYKEMELGREASLKRMSRCRSLPVSHNTRVMGDSLVQQLVSEVFPSRNKMGLEKSNKSETLLVSCEGRNKSQETTEAITESNKEARLEMRSPSLVSDLRVEERTDESAEKTPLFSETYEATIGVEEKTVMLKRSETEQTRGIELSLGLSTKHMESCEADDSSEETKGPRENLQNKKANTFETPDVSCVESNKAQVTTEAITESNKETILEIRSPSFRNDLRTDERRDESTEKTPLLCQDKTETYEATIDVEEKTVMLKRSETEKTRGFELSLGLSMKPSDRFEADDGFEETLGRSGDNLLEKKASLDSMKGRVRKRSKSSLLGTCLCCATAMN